MALRPGGGLPHVVQPDERGEQLRDSGPGPGRVGSVFFIHAGRGRAALVRLVDFDYGREHGVAAERAPAILSKPVRPVLASAHDAHVPGIADPLHLASSRISGGAEPTTRLS